MNEAEKTDKNVWQKKQDAIAERAGVSVLVVEGHQPPALAVSNNNSICRVVQSSATHAVRCEPFCGTAYQKALEAGEPINYRCHAGLYCIAAPLETESKPLVAIVGRTFLKTADYRDLTERIFLGDWQNLPEIELFENVNISGSAADLEQVTARLQNLNAAEKAELSALIETPPAPSEEETTILPEDEFSSPAINESENDVLELEVDDDFLAENDNSEVLVLDESGNSQQPALARFNESSAAEILTGEPISAPASWRDSIGAALRSNYAAAVDATMNFVAENFGLENLAWLESERGKFNVLRKKGEFGDGVLRVNLEPGDEDLKHAAKNKTTLRLENKNTGDEIELFPISAETAEIRAAIAVGGSIADDELRNRLSSFLAEIALPLEVLCLRADVERRARLQNAVSKFNSNLQAPDEESFLDSLVENSVALVGARRGSLLFFDENEQILRAAAATGLRAEEIKGENGNLGDRIAFRVWQETAPAIVSDVVNSGLPPAPRERNYQSNSFLSLPLSIGGKKIGVLNVTEKGDSTAFNENDLQLLENIAPQLAIALDRAVLSRKAGEYETASITDALTGLVNRRYLTARLEEEIRRSQRHGYPLSFLMIDVDYFKNYNDKFGHQAGDDALKIVANSLTAALRGADVAARFGGEEFSILLPQTTQSEARAIAERIRKRVETTIFPHDKITVSIGVASFSQRLETLEALVKAADDALYEAKRAGRNNVQVYSNGNNNGH